MGDAKPEEKLPDNLRDLDKYREERIKDGSWPISKEQHLDFFRRWRERKDK